MARKLYWMKVSKWIYFGCLNALIYSKIVAHDETKAIIPTIGNAVLNEVKRRINALNSTIFRRNTSGRFTSRFFARRRPSFFPPIFVVLRADVERRWNTPVFAVLNHLRSFTTPFSRTWELHDLESSSTTIRENSDTYDKGVSRKSFFCSKSINYARGNLEKRKWNYFIFT